MPSCSGHKHWVSGKLVIINHRAYNCTLMMEVRRILVRSCSGETVKAEEMIAIADALGIIFEQRFILEDGSEIRFNNIGGM